jgi:methylated-DNA-[protein]-cysteine S-methyltransferase
MQYDYKKIQTPVGQLTLVANDHALIAVLWENDDPNRVKLVELNQNLDHSILNETEKQLIEYFAGQRTKFNLPLEFQGTAFQKSVWSALLNIPFGETRTYKDIAESIGNVKAVRAVGAANGKNPISIIAPCHRVIGANGNLVGFAGGLENKQILLKLES